jgi:hypothetical protein
MAINGYLAIDDNGKPIQVLRPNTTQKLTTGQVTTEFTFECVVRIVSEDNAHYKVGADPTATTNDVFLPAGIIETIKLHKGDKVSVLGSTAYITLME